MTKAYIKKLLRLAKEINKMPINTMITNQQLLTKINYLIGYIEALEENDH